MTDLRSIYQDMYDKFVAQGLNLEAISSIRLAINTLVLL